MFFVVSKLLESFLQPSNAVALVGVAGALLLLARRARAGRTLLLAAVALLLLFGWLPPGRAALVALEDRFPRPQIEGPITGIVVLGGAVDVQVSANRGTVSLNPAAERFTVAAALSRRFPDARLLLSGGISRLLSDQIETESSLGRDLLVSIGVAPDRITLEQKSRNTCENAVDSKQVAQPKPGERWILVTSAYHMPRAVACFRAAGFPIIPYPVDYRTEKGHLWQLPRTIADGLEISDIAAHEWIGLVAYHFVKGTELFPGPARP